MEILPDVYAREDTFGVDAEPVTLIDSEIRSQSLKALAVWQEQSKTQPSKM